MLKMWPKTSSSTWTALLKTTLRVKLVCQMQTFTSNKSQLNRTWTRISISMDFNHKINLHTTMKLMITWFQRAQWCKTRRMRLPTQWDLTVLTLFKSNLRKLAEMPLLTAEAEIGQLRLKMVKDLRPPTFSTKLWLKSLGVKIENSSLLLTKRRSQTLNHSILNSHNCQTITQWECSLHLKHALISLKLLKSKWCRTRTSAVSADSVKHKTTTQLKCSLHSTWSQLTRWTTSTTQALAHLSSASLIKIQSKDLLWLLK